VLILYRQVSSGFAQTLIDDRSIDCRVLDAEEFHSDIQAYDRALHAQLALRGLDVVLLDPALPPAFLIKTAMQVCEKLPTLPVLILPQSGPPRRHTADAVRHVCTCDQLNRSLLQLALKDELTNLYNRRGFTMLANQQLLVARNMGRSLWLFFADVDGLKRINDSLGHEAGDEVLKFAATCFRKSFRRVDVTARIGGDEFVALTSGTNGRPDTICRRLQHNVSVHDAVQRRYSVSLSVGWARFDPSAPSTLRDLMAQADRALYAQRQQKNAAGRPRDAGLGIRTRQGSCEQSLSKPRLVSVGGRDSGAQPLGLACQDLSASEVHALEGV
jgi:diguanylate cyclase (GGDEF)-like protein